MTQDEATHEQSKSGHLMFGDHFKKNQIEGKNEMNKPVVLITGALSGIGPILKTGLVLFDEASVPDRP